MKKSLCRSRKRTALGRCALLLCLVALYLLSTDFCFTRSAALRNADREAYLSPTTVIQQLENDAGNFYLCANEDAMSFRRVYFTWSQGWVSSNAIQPALPGDPAPNGISGHAIDGRPEQMTYLFGRINSPEVTQLEVRFRSSGKDVPQVSAETILIGQENFFIGPDGRSYFLESLPFPVRDVIYKVTALDKNLQPLPTVVAPLSEGYFFSLYTE